MLYFLFVAGRFNFQLVAVVLDALPFLFIIDYAEFAEVLDTGQCGVDSNALVHQKAQPLPVFRQITHTFGNGMPGMLPLEFLAVDDNPAAGFGYIAEKNIHQFRAARANQPGNTQDLAPVQLKGDIFGTISA